MSYMTIRWAGSVIKKSFDPCNCGNEYFTKVSEYDRNHRLKSFKRHKFTCKACSEESYSEWMPFHLPTGIVTRGMISW